jgi:Spy/CpxP family protein refolding chaperone
MKKLFLGLIISAVAIFAVADLMARGGGGPGYGAGNCGEGPGPGFEGGPGYGKHSYMKKELGITDKQEQQMFDIGTKYRQKFFDNRNDPEKLKVLREEKRKEMDSVFTKEQLEKIKKFHDQKGKRGRGHGPHRDWDGNDRPGDKK